jgi:hypothetical protein
MNSTVPSPQAKINEMKLSQSSAFKGCFLILLARYLKMTTTTSIASRRLVTATTVLGDCVAINMAKKTNEDVGMELNW